jgi:two-component system, NarL family, sensor histidine kinase EvgS
MLHRILIVDAHRLHARVLARQLESLGHRALCAHDEDEAALLFSAGRFSLAAIACGPRDEGASIARRFREAGGGAHDSCRVVVYATDEAIAVSAAMTADANAWFVVPVAMERLATLLQSLRGASIDVAPAADLAQWQLFESTSRDDLAAARTALGEGRRDAVAASLHRIKGAALMLRQSRIAEACAHAEVTTGSAQAARVREGIDAVEARLVEAAVAIGARRGDQTHGIR